MHYLVRNITIRDGDVILNVATSDSRHKKYFRGTLDELEGASIHKKLVEVGRMLYCGDLQFKKSSDCKAKTVYDNCKRKHGTYRNHFNTKDSKKYRERFASEFARRMYA